MEIIVFDADLFGVEPENPIVEYAVEDFFFALRDTIDDTIVKISLLKLQNHVINRLHVYIFLRYHLFVNILQLKVFVTLRGTCLVRR